MKKVTINGKEYPCTLTIGVLKKFKDETGKEIDEVKDVFSVCTLLFMAAVTACKKEKTTFPWDSAEALMDDIELSEIESITAGLFGVERKTDGADQKKTDEPKLIVSLESPSV